MGLSVSGYADSDALRVGLDRYAAAKASGRELAVGSMICLVIRALGRLIHAIARENAHDKAIRVADLEQAGRTAVADAVKQYASCNVRDPLPYFRTIIRNAIRREAGRIASAAHECCPIPPLPSIDLIEEAERRMEIAGYLDRLPATHQAILQMRFWEQRSEVEIARQLGVTQQAVHGKISRALKRLKGLMEHDQHSYKAT